MHEQIIEPEKSTHGYGLGPLASVLVQPIGSALSHSRGFCAFCRYHGIAITILANIGTGNQEAFQLLDNTSRIMFALTYLVMFAIPLIGAAEKPLWSVRCAALSGFLMTLLYVVLSSFPI